MEGFTQQFENSKHQVGFPQPRRTRLVFVVKLTGQKGGNLYD